MLEHDYSWQKGELKFGYVPPDLLAANLFKGIIEDILVNQAKFTEDGIRCPYKVDNQNGSKLYGNFTGYGRLQQRIWKIFGIL